VRIFDIIAYQIRDVLNRGRVDVELDDELTSYIEMMVAERVRGGEAESDARRAARFFAATAALPSGAVLVTGGYAEENGDLPSTADARLFVPRTRQRK
jgi:hypothetical protein